MFEFRREDLFDAFNGNGRVVRQFEQTVTQVTESAVAVDANATAIADVVADTTAIADASYVTLSANASLTNERVLTAGNLITITPTSGLVTVAVDKLSISGAFTIGLTLTANSALTLPTTGTLATLAGAEVLTNKTLDQVRTGQTPTAAVIPSTHKVPIRLNGVDYFILLST